MVQIFSDGLREFWSRWEIRGFVLMSLVVQAILILVGNTRKSSANKYIKFVVWLSYLSANWIAMVALGVLSGAGDAKEDFTKPEHTITAFWAPFLLLHLGGPDTVTAYSLEDNELWWRHFVTLIFQVGVAFYIVVRAWTGGYALNYLSIPVFVAGFLKIGERTWVQRRASNKYFRKSMLSKPEPGPNYGRYMAEYNCKRREGFEVSSIKMFEAPKTDEHVVSAIPTGGDHVRGEDYLRDARSFFVVFRQLFADLILSLNDMENSMFFFRRSSCETVFKVIEIELGFVYDVFYTKSAVIFSLPGGFVRLISFSATLVAFLFFIPVDKSPYDDLDVGITYVLLSGAIALEIYALLWVLCSDRAMLWLSGRDKAPAYSLYEAVSKVNPPKRKRWSNKMARYNLISMCSESKPTKWKYLQKGLCVYETMEMSRYKELTEVPKSLRELVFARLKKRSARVNLRDRSRQREDENCPERMGGSEFDRRIRSLLREEKCLDNLGLGDIEMEFDHSVLLWHIATDLCYYSDELRTDSSAKENSKLLSEYMMYLVAMRPAMLPEGIGQIRLQDTKAEGDEFFRGRVFGVDPIREARKALSDVKTDVAPLEVKGDKSKSVLFDACVLAKELRSLKWDEARKWEMVSRVWVEMLSYAAGRCNRGCHVQQLRQGGELLTHVWLLMAHLGITEQFQVSKGHARAKLDLQ